MRLTLLCLALVGCASVPKAPVDPTPCVTRFREIRSRYGNREPDYLATTNGIRTFYYQTVANGVTTRNHYSLRHVEFSAGPSCDSRTTTEVLRSQK